MRTLVIAAFATALVATSAPVEAQRIAPPQNGGWQAGPGGGAGRWEGGGNWQGGARPAPAPRPMPNSGPRRGSRWGGRVNGYWYAGMQAPGGWNAYRRMKRGRTLPRYWVSPAFFIGDWGSYGLMAPPPGYFWTRYYNDAVLADQYGHVYDSVGGINWDTYGAYDDGDYGYDGPPPPYGAPYPAPGYGGPGYPPPGATYSQSRDGRVRTWTSSTVAGGGYAPVAPIVVPTGAVATVTVPGAVTTTTTTEYVEESYAPKRVIVKRVYRAPVKRKWRPRPKPRCGCVVGS